MEKNKTRKKGHFRGKSRLAYQKIRMSEWPTYFANNGFSVLENRSAKLCRATAVTSPEPK